MQFDSTQDPQQVSQSTPEPQAPAPAAPASVEPPASPAAPANEPASPPPHRAEGEAPVPGEGDPATPPPFTPKAKFKAWRAEHDVPEWARSLVKDPETETKVIELLEKSMGLDQMKPKLEERTQERDTLRQQLDGFTNRVQDLRSDFQRGDIDLWLQKLGVPSQTMLQWALDKVNYSQLPPEQQRILDERTEAQRRAYQLEQQQGTQEQQFQEQQRQAKAMLLDSGLARPDIQTFVEAFDSRVGKPGEFRQEVIRHGQTEYLRSQGKTDLTPDQAIQAVMERYKTFLQPQAAAPAQPGQAGGAPTPRVVERNHTVPTIPNVQGKPASPMKAAVESLDDLRKLAKQAASAR